jgi:hypothetical protein
MPPPGVHGSSAATVPSKKLRKPSGDAVHGLTLGSQEDPNLSSSLRNASAFFALKPLAGRRAMSSRLVARQSIFRAALHASALLAVSQQWSSPTHCNVVI